MNIYVFKITFSRDCCKSFCSVYEYVSPSLDFLFFFAQYIVS